MNPSLDVSDIIESPEFNSRFVVIRNTQVVGNDGIAVDTPTRIEADGVVTPASGLRIVRTPEGQMVVGDIDIVTTFELSEGSVEQGNDADIVVFDHISYTIINVAQYRFGGGFVRAAGRMRRVEPLDD